MLKSAVLLNCDLCPDKLINQIMLKILEKLSSDSRGKTFAILICLS